MINPYHLLPDPIEFVAAGAKIQDRLYSTRKKQSNNLSGNDARKIYEEIVNEEIPGTNSELHPKPQAVTTRVRSKRKRQCNEAFHQLTYKDFYCAAQAGDLETVKNCVCGAKLDVNETDTFSWTPLMMAAHEGHADVVLFLLSKGASWTDKIDASGYDARELACLGGHPEIIDYLTHSEKYIRRQRVEAVAKMAEKHIKREKLWCNVCKSHYHAAPYSQQSATDPHVTSTVHLFSDNDFQPKCHSHFYIANSNKGYQLLQRDGWDGESGLGPNKDGNKYPVKTVLKRDKLGVGSYRTSDKARVTHFESFDESAVSGRMSGKSTESKWQKKKSMRKQTEKERQKEIRFRRLFH